LLTCLVSLIALLFHSPLSAQQKISHLKWVYFIEQTNVQSPAIGAHGTIYIGTGMSDTCLQSNGVYAINPNGTLKWKITYGKPIHSSIVLDAHENLYFIVGNADNPDRMDAALVSLDSSGRPRWTFDRIGWMAPIPNTGFTPAIASDGTVYVCGRYSLFAVNQDGTMKLKYDFPLIDNVNSAGTRQTTGSQRSAPTIAKDGTVYVNTEHGGHEGTEVQGGVYAFAPDGSLKWRSYDVGGDAAPVIDKEGTIYSAIGRYEDAADTSDLARAAQDAKVLAIRPDGTIKWSVTTLLWIESSPSIGADGTLYVGTSHHPLNKPGWFYAISPDGQIKWKYDTYDDVKDMPPAQQNPPDIYNSPAIDSNGLVYFGNEIGCFYALRPDGKVEWMENLQSIMHGSPAIADDGTLYYSTHTEVDVDHHFGLIALDTRSHGLADSPWPKFRRNNANTGSAQAYKQPVSVERTVVPGTCELFANYPNPFNPSTTIEFSLPHSGYATLKVYNTLGEQVAELLSENRDAGMHRVEWKAANLPTGMYFYRLQAGEFMQTRKLVLVK
jgi:outer membrane protein assembly factor BamB